MKGSTTPTLSHWVRICCTNWKFVRHPDELKSYDMEQYRKYRIETAEYVMSHPIWIEYEKNIPEDIFLNERRSELNENKSKQVLDDLFEDITKVVYKILDSDDIVNSIKKDF